MNNAGRAEKFGGLLSGRRTRNNRPPCVSAEKVHQKRLSHKQICFCESPALHSPTAHPSPDTPVPAGRLIPKSLRYCTGRTVRDCLSATRAVFAEMVFTESFLETGFLRLPESAELTTGILVAAAIRTFGAQIYMDRSLDRLDNIKK